MAFFVVSAALSAALIFLIVPLGVRLEAYFDLDRKTSILNFHFLGKHILKYRIYLSDGVFFYSINGHAGKKLQNVKQGIQMTIALKSLYREIHFKRVDVLMSYGAADNPFETALVTAGVNQLISAAMTLISPERFHFVTAPDFNNQKLSVDLKTAMRITPLGVLAIVSESLRLTRKKQDDEKQDA